MRLNLSINLYGQIDIALNLARSLTFLYP